MGFVTVFKKIGKGFVHVGKGAVKVVDVAADVADHPAVDAGLVALSVFVPIKQAQFALQCVRHVDEMADKIKADHDRMMSDEEKRAEFAAEFKKKFPEASNGDLVTLASVLVKLNKAGAELEETEDPS